jgi:hypothetical protein
LFNSSFKEYQALSSRLAAVFLLIICKLAIAQDEFHTRTVNVERGKPLVEFLSGIEQQKRLKFYYLEEWLEPFALNLGREQGTVEQILTEVLEGSDIGFVFLHNYAVIFYKDPQRELERDAIKETAINNQIRVDEQIIGSSRTFVPGTRVTLKGTVLDKETNQPVVGASIHVSDLDIGAQTDARGQYQFALPGGEFILTFRHINYEVRLLSLSLYADGTVNTQLEEVPTTLDAVVVSDQVITTKRVGLTSIKMNDLARTPTFLGEKDVIKMLQVQTGVTAVSEASTGYNVRGGGVDQNLVLYDGVPIFNTGHAFGFFTAFNSDAIKDAAFYKGGIPAEFGGRVSSVLNMTSREGDFYRWKGNAGIGFVSSNVAVEGPIKRDTSSIMISLRSTYSDWLLNLIQTKYQDVEQSSVAFYDGSIKYAQKLSNGAKLTVSTYASHDKFRLANDTTNSWQNMALAVRYDHSRNQDLYYSVGLYAGRYSYTVSEADPPTAFDLSYKIFYPSLKIDFNRDGNHKQTFGLHTTFYNFKPGELRAASSESNVASISMPDENAVETALYFSDSFYWGERLNIEAGLRISIFNRIGKGLMYLYQPGESMQPRNVIDSIQYGSGELMKTYGGPEPRLSIQYMLNPQSSIKLGYNRIYQYVHLISNTASVTPVDIWQSSNAYFKPQLGDQVSVGYFRNSKSNSVEGFVEVYLKRTQNILDFKDGANLILNPKLETALLLGTGVAYGAEFSIEKTKGRLVGAINYTYSRSFRRVTGNFETEEINNGDYYPSNIDQPNIVNVNWQYGLRRNVFFSGSFTYHTGRPVSIPIAAYEIDGAPIIDFSERNNYRLPDYHRMDLALIIEGGNRKRKLLKGQWTFSIYNVYGRKNPYSAFYTYNVAGAVKPYQLSLIGVPVPSVSYSIKF